MKSFLRSFFAALLALLVLLVVVIGAVALKSSQKAKIEDHSFLVVDIYGDILEYNPPAGVMGSIAGGGAETLQRILENLEKAAVDERIDGVILKLSANHNAGYAKLEEIRGALNRVQQAGKPVYGFSDSMNRKTYFLAAACDSLFMPTSGYIDFTGLASMSLHVKEALEKLGIKPNLHQIKDYKAAAELIIRDDMSRYARENAEWLLAETWEMTISALCEDRDLTEEQITAVMEQAVLTPDEGRAVGLIDDILFWDELETRLMREGDDELRTVGQCRYADVKRGDLDLDGKHKIAVVHAQGMIGGRESGFHPLFGMTMGHASVCEQLREVRKDDDIAAVVFRVESGGGEGLASDLISHEVHITNDEKPVVASMVDIAGSGGYMVCYRAGKIVADPLTRTGSIGSISMKFNMQDFYEKLGINFDAVTRGPNGLMWSAFTDFTEDQRARFEENHWDGFNAWLAEVARFRGMTFEEAEQLAHGRVWSGRQAKANGLIDELGGLDRAIALAKDMAEIPSDEKVTIVHYPPKKSFIEEILSGEGNFARTASWILYRTIRQELARTWEMLSHGPLYLSDEVVLD